MEMDMDKTVIATSGHFKKVSVIGCYYLATFGHSYVGISREVLALPWRARAEYWNNLSHEYFKYKSLNIDTVTPTLK